MGKNIHLIIFDLDGTLLNTLEDLADSVNFILSENDFPDHPLEDYKTFVGRGIDDLLRRSLPKDFENPEKFMQIRRNFVEHYEAHKFNKTKPYDGILDLLDELIQSNIQLAVASNKYHAATVELVGRYFAKIPFVAAFGHRKDKLKKPAPQIVEDILQIAKTGKENTLYVGDSSVDMKTAKSAGVKSIGVTWGFRSEEELKENGADFIIHHPKELMEVLGQLQ